MRKTNTLRVFIKSILFIFGLSAMVIWQCFVFAQDPGQQTNAELNLSEQNFDEQVNAAQENTTSKSSDDVAAVLSSVSQIDVDTSLSENEVVVKPVSIQDGQNKKIILDVFDLRDMDIKDVLKLIASKTGMNIVAGGNISGRVTMFMQNVEVHDALQIILESNDLAYSEQDGMIRIMTSQDFEKTFGYKFGLKTKSKVFILKGMKPSDALVVLNQVKSVVGKIVADDQSNTIMIEDTPDQLERMEEYLKQIDSSVTTQVFELHYIQAEDLSKKIQDMLTTKLGTARFDLRSNKMFIKDTADKLKEIALFIDEVDVPRSTEVFELSYVKAEAMVKLVTPVLTENVGHVEFDAVSNKVIVTDTSAKMVEVARIINAMDRKQKEVLIEARIVQIILQDEFRMGVDWEALVSRYNNLDLKNNFSNLGSAVTNKGSLSIGTLSEDHYTAVLEALDEEGTTRVLSNPKIAVVNNEEAKILIGSTKPYVTTTTTTNSGGPATTAEAVNFIDVGVKLHVTPTIHNDGYITMKIKPEVSSAATSITTSTNNEIPIVDTSEVETVIRVKDGVTIILGGLMKEEKSDTRKGIPWLGKIPLLGAAFRNIDKSSVRTEIVIFLTPRIITGDIEAPENKNVIYHQ